MTLLPAQLHTALRANAINRQALAAQGKPFDPVPLLKLFNPVGAARWLATELDTDCDTLFGLADLGFGCPDLGYFSLAEIASVRLPFGLRVERDIAFDTPFALSRWARTARRAGSILSAEILLRRAAADELPPASA